MKEVIDVIAQLLGYLPPQLVNTGIILYLFWFSSKHGQDHKVIMQRLDAEEDKSKTIEKKIEDVYMLTLKGMITNESLPISVRLEFYDQYKNLGGNSWVEHYAETNLMGRLDGQHYGRRKDDVRIDD